LITVRVFAPRFTSRMVATCSLFALAACGSGKDSSAAADILGPGEPKATIFGTSTSGTGSSQNLIQNPGFETASNGLPAKWTRESSGNKTPTFTYPVAGRTGNGAMVAFGSKSSGDARWQHDAVSVSSLQFYTVSLWYKSNIPSEVTAEYTNFLGFQSNRSLANLPSSNGAWVQYTTTFLVPLLQSKVSVYQSIEGAGSLTIDDFVLVAGTSLPTPAPGVTIQANPATIASGATSTISWSSTNATSCTATGGWSGSKGTSGSQTVTPASTTTYTLACTGPGGNSTQSAVVTVTSPQPPTGNFTEGLVSFSFDDSWDTQYTNALPILEAAGFKGTFYLTTNQIEQNYQFFMTPAMVKDIAARGHEIAGHTVTHPDLQTLTAAQIQAEIINSRNYLRTLTGKPVNGFAYPFGSYNATVVSLVQQTYTHARSTNYVELNSAQAPKYELNSQCIDKSETLANIKARIDAAKAGKKWYILCMHEVKDTGGDNLTMTPAFFSQIVTYVKQTGIKVVTVEQGRALMP